MDSCRLMSSIFPGCSQCFLLTSSSSSEKTWKVLNIQSWLNFILHGFGLVCFGSRLVEFGQYYQTLANCLETRSTVQSLFPHPGFCPSKPLILLICKRMGLKSEVLVSSPDRQAPAAHSIHNKSFLYSKSQ